MDFCQHTNLLLKLPIKYSLLESFWSSTIYYIFWIIKPSVLVSIDFYSSAVCHQSVVLIVSNTLGIIFIFLRRSTELSQAVVYLLISERLKILSMCNNNLSNYCNSWYSKSFIVSRLPVDTFYQIKRHKNVKEIKSSLTRIIYFSFCFYWNNQTLHVE